MATRNLTIKFKQLRDSHNSRRNHANDRQIGMEPLQIGSDDFTKSVNTLPPFWVDTVEDVNSIVNDIKKLISRLEECHKKRLLVTFDESEASQDREIDTLTKQVTVKFREAEKHLAKIGKDAQTGNGEEINVRMNIQRSIATQLQQLSLSFRKSQKEYLSRVRNQKSAGGGIGLGFDIEAGSNAEKRQQNQQKGLTDQEILILESSEINVQERDIEIQRIAKSIEELSAIFKELAVLVIDQGTILDRIDYNMEQVVESVKKGNTELEQAAAYQASPRAMYCIGVLVFLIIIFMIILVVKHS